MFRRALLHPCILLLVSAPIMTGCNRCLQAPPSSQPASPYAVLIDQLAEDLVKRKHVRGVRSRIHDLMVARYKATNDVMRRIDQANLESETPLIESLFYVLGYVHDPSVIPWLRHKFRSNYEVFVKNWLDGWSASLGRSMHGADWLDEPDAWAVFLVELYDRDSCLEKERRLIDCARCFAGRPEVAAYYNRLIHDAGGSPHDIIEMGAAMRLFGVPTDDDLLNSAILLFIERNGSECFLERYYPPMLPSEVIVPALIDFMNSSQDETSNIKTQQMLEKHTLAFDVAGAEQWREWRQTHGHLKRIDWAREAYEKIDAIAQKNSEQAAAILAKQWPLGFYEPPLIAFLEKWVEHPAMCPIVANFIVSLEGRLPERSARKRIIEAILAERPEMLGEAQGEWRRICEFEREAPATWEEYVESLQSGCH